MDFIDIISEGYDIQDENLDDFSVVYDVSSDGEDPDTNTNYFVCSCNFATHLC